MLQQGKQIARKWYPMFLKARLGRVLCHLWWEHSSTVSAQLQGDLGEEGCGPGRGNTV